MYRGHIPKNYNLVVKTYIFCIKNIFEHLAGSRWILLEANLIQELVTYQKMVMYVIYRFFGMRISNMIPELYFGHLAAAGTCWKPNRFDSWHLAATRSCRIQRLKVKNNLFCQTWNSYPKTTINWQIWTFFGMWLLHLDQVGLQQNPAAESCLIIEL